MFSKWNKPPRRHAGLYALGAWGLFALLAGFDFRPDWVLWGGFLSSLILVGWAVVVSRQDYNDALDWQKKQGEFWSRTYNGPPTERRSEPENPS